MREHTLSIMLKTAKKEREKRDSAHIMGADGHFESYAIVQSVPLASSLHSSHSLQTKMLSTLLHCSDFLLTRSRSFLRLREGETSKTTVSRKELGVLFN